MEPSIGRSIGQGFRAANRSWAGIGLAAGSWLVVGLFVILSIALTKVPEELFRQPAAAPTATPPAVHQPASPTPPTPPTSAAPTETTTPENSQADLFKQMAKTDEATRPAQEAADAVSRNSHPRIRHRRNGRGRSVSWMHGFSVRGRWWYSVSWS